MNFRTITLFAVLLFCGAAFGFAQEHEPADAAGRSVDSSRQEGRPSLLRELGLSHEQMRQIRQINIQRKPQMERAQSAHRDAMKALDAAIYADIVNDSDVSARIRDLQTAQAEIATLRFESELSVRKVLTAEQLARFREIRQSFAEQREKFRKNRGRGRMPLRQFRRQGGALRNVQ